jgi:hypothetical protein
MFFDNVEHTLSSPSLAAALTTSEWSDRILGRSEMTRAIPQRATWIATGNNLKVGGDLARRCYSIRLDAQTARPWTRTGFRHEQLLRYALGRRGTILHALLTIVRAWFAAGCPKADVPRLGNFDAWANAVGGVLAHAGIDGFLGNLERLYQQVDEEEVAWEGFVKVLHATYGSRPVTVSELTADMRKSDGATLREALPPDLGEHLPGDGTKNGDGNFRKRLGKALAKRVDAVFDVYKIERAGTDEHTNTIRWRIAVAQREPGQEG